MICDLLIGADPISFSKVDELEQSAPDIIIYAAPFMFFFVVVEYVVSRIQSHGLYEKKEMLGSTLVGLGNVVIGVFLKTAILYLFIFVYNLLPWRMEFKWWTFIPCYIVF